MGEFVCAVMAELLLAPLLAAAAANRLETSHF
jgi:hypothetical protein